MMMNQLENKFINIFYLKNLYLYLNFKIVKMLVIIIGLFFICWAPIKINNILVGFGKLPNANEGVLWHLRIYFFLLSYFNSCVNPVVYAFMSRNFREGFKISIKICLKRNKMETSVSRKRQSTSTNQRYTTQTTLQLVPQNDELDE
jgi:hypothetical protein